jgi:hypothetical protein
MADLTDLNEVGSKLFFDKMSGAPEDAVALIKKIQQHFGSKADSNAYFRNVPDLRLEALWKNANGVMLDQVFATIQWRPTILVFRVGAFIQPSVWTALGFEGANLFTKDPLISYISIPPTDWRKNEHGLLSALEAAKRDMLTRNRLLKS